MQAPIPFGNYELLERIAEGGMAEVWKARARGVAGFQKTVVIKRVLPALLEKPGFAELLVREARIAARLSHPNIIQIFDLGEEGGGYFIAMEHLRGRDLAAALSLPAQGDPPLHLALRLWIAAEVAKALDYAHRAKGEDGKALHIVHRDVSPQNVLLGFEGEVKVADFGIARADEEGLGRGEDPRVLRGKYAYMSPEQARGEPLDRRSDLFALGVLLYELVTRRRMYRGKTQAETLDCVRRAALPDYRAGLPIRELPRILDRALAGDREQRYASAAEIHGELMKILYSIGKPVSQLDLARAMQRMFAPVELSSPNKLTIDVLARARADAAAQHEARASQEVTVPPPHHDDTAALPAGKSARTERRRLAFLAARPRPGDERSFELAVQASGGELLPADKGLLLAMYGVERAIGHAVRGALELRAISKREGPARVDPSPATVVFGGEAHVGQDGAIEPDAEVAQRAHDLLGRTEPGEIRMPVELRREIGLDLRARKKNDDLLIEGFRAKRPSLRPPSMSREASLKLVIPLPLVGRKELLRTLSALMIEAAQGRGELVNLVGEAGAGKTRLLEELRASAASDFVFLHARADEATELSFGPLADLTLELAGIEPDDTPAERFEKMKRLRELGLAEREIRMLGELIGLAFPFGERARAGRPRAIELAIALRRALVSLAKKRVVVLMLEDMQWMDDATSQLLPLLVGGLGERTFVLATRRPGEATPLAGRTMEVPPLDARSTAKLLALALGARAVAPELAARAHEETGGIPEWIELYAEALRPQIVIEDEIARADAADVLPDAVRSAVAARVERLRGRDRSILRIAAALGQVEPCAEVSLLGAVLGLVGHTERPAVRRLLAKRLLVSDEPAKPVLTGAWGGDERDARLPARVRLPNELLRRAVLAELDEGEQRRLHARIVATLERLGAAGDALGLARLAEHARRSIDPRRAVPYYVQAAELGDRADAGRLLAQAAAVLRAEDGPDDRRASELALRAAEEALAANALDVAEEALAPLADADIDPDLFVRAAIVQARCAHRRLTPQRAVAILERAAATLDAVEPALKSEALGWLGWAYNDAGDPLRAVVVLKGALESCEGEARGRTLALYGATLARVDRLEKAEAAVSEALALAVRTGAGAVRYAALAASASLLEAQGQLDAAARRYREAFEVALTVAEPGEIAGLNARAAALALLSGDDAEASARVAEAERWARRLAQEAWAEVASAVRAALAGRAKPADRSFVAEIVEAAERLERIGRPGEAALVAELLARAHAAFGDAAASARTLERAAALAERAGHLAYARRLRASAP